MRCAVVARQGSDNGAPMRSIPNDCGEAAGGGAREILAAWLDAAVGGAGELGALLQVAADPRAQTRRAVLKVMNVWWASRRNRAARKTRDLITKTV